MTLEPLSVLQTELRKLETREGPRPLARRLGISLGKLRSLIDGRDAKATSVAEVADALGYDFYVGPPRPTDPDASSSSPVVLGPGDVRDVEIDITPAGRVALEAVIGPHGTAQMMMTPAVAKEVATHLIHCALTIEDRDKMAREQARAAEGAA